MPLPWYYHDIGNVVNLHQETIDSLEQRFAALEQYTRDLERHVCALEALLAAHGITPPEEVPSPDTPPPPPDAPAVFPARTEETVACPRCGRRQRGDRDCCYACQVPFRYENE